MRAPDFWDRSDPLSRLAVAALSPIGAIYSASVRWKFRNAEPYRCNAPVICIGNISAGGTGKTPTAIAVADAVIAHGKNPFFLTRGYGGRLKGPLVVAKEHSAADVGDEPLLLSRKAATVVSRDRRAGAELAYRRGADVIVMDDGHQNFSLAKDISIVVVDAATGFGNGRVLPAGPLREYVRQGLARADAVILMGDGDPQLDGFDGPVLRAHIEAAPGENWKGKRVVAFAGIGRPEKFFGSLKSLGAEIVAALPLPDHHLFAAEELARFEAMARDQNAQLITTEKDFVRLAAEVRQNIAVLPIRAVFEPPHTLDRLLDRLAEPR
jgi:tetraacyldisaccharide 4'-kinase